jgi:hypothetical protein
MTKMPLPLKTIAAAAKRLLNGLSAAYHSFFHILFKPVNFTPSENLSRLDSFFVALSGLRIRQPLGRMRELSLWKRC